MKEKILLLIIGILVGAIIATGAFYIFTTTNNDDSNECTCENMRNKDGNPPEMPNVQPNETTDKFRGIQDNDAIEKEDNSKIENN